MEWRYLPDWDDEPAYFPTLKLRLAESQPVVYFWTTLRLADGINLPEAKASLSDQFNLIALDCETGETGSWRITGQISLGRK